MTMRVAKNRRATVAFILYAGLLGLLIVAADAGWLRKHLLLLHRMPWGDKAGHFLLFGILSFLANWIICFGEFRRGRLHLSKVSAALIALVFVEELTQLCFRSRTFDVLDIVAGALGIWLFGQWARRRRKQLLIRPPTNVIASVESAPFLKMEPAAGASQPPVNQTQ